MDTLILPIKNLKCTKNVKMHARSEYTFLRPATQVMAELISGGVPSQSLRGLRLCWMPMKVTLRTKTRQHFHYSLVTGNNEH